MIIFFVGVQTAFSQEVIKPNIIFIVVDDLNDYIDDLDALPVVETPNINRIADKGTVFTNAYAPSPLCCPSRTSFLTGKDTYYTDVYSSSTYECNKFNKNFTPADNNATYFTIPGYFKDQANYFTYGINKIFHCYENYQEYDSITADPCAKDLSWNKILVYVDSNKLVPGVTITEEGVHNNQWSKINDTLERFMMDYVAVDSSIKFVRAFADGYGTCGRPFFLALGIKKPHIPLYIPAKYFNETYVEDFYETPFDIPYNFPFNAFPINGIQLPPQPEVPFSDLFALPEDGMGQNMVKGADNNFIEWAESFYPLPEINPDFNDSLTTDILTWSKRANCFLAYVAGVKFIDAQIGRLLDSLEAVPDVYNNTIIVLIGDNGYSLGEKKHWGKRDLWETDIRVPFIIADLRNPNSNINQSNVSLLDIFPTLCSLTDIEPPTFPDNSNYLDGKDISNLMQNSEVYIESPKLAAVLKEQNTEGFCNPQYTVRSGRFHYIKYKSNGGGELLCDSAGSYIEEELYEVGINRNVDPNEWNNLAPNLAYSPVINFLSQWLPTGKMYLKKALSPTIKNSVGDCLFNYTDTIELNVEIMDTLGNPYTLNTDYIYAWTNNLTSDTILGTSVSFPLSAISPDLWTTNDKIYFYFSIINPANNSIIGFDIKCIYINNLFTPVADFNLIVSDDFVINVIDFEISGTYINYWWTIEGDSLFYNVKPGPYDFNEPGTYTYICNVQYGNDNCIATVAKTKTTGNYNYYRDNFISLVPNPAKDHVTVVLKTSILNGELMIYNISGSLVKRVTMYDNYNSYFEINQLGLESGVYYIAYFNNGEVITNPLIIAK